MPDGGCITASADFAPSSIDKGDAALRIGPEDQFVHALDHRSQALFAGRHTQSRGLQRVVHRFVAAQASPGHADRGDDQCQRGAAGCQCGGDRVIEFGLHAGIVAFNDHGDRQLAQGSKRAHRWFAIDASADKTAAFAGRQIVLEEAVRTGHSAWRHVDFFRRSQQDAAGGKQCCGPAFIGQHQRVLVGKEVGVQGCDQVQRFFFWAGRAPGDGHEAVRMGCSDTLRHGCQVAPTHQRAQTVGGAGCGQRHAGKVNHQADVVAC